MNLNHCKIENGKAMKKVLDDQLAPIIIECKKTFWGSEDCVDCRLILKESNRILLFHEIEKQWDIDGMIIKPPMFTIATYWINRPYNLYCWFNKDGSYVAAYFNVVELPGYRFENNMLIYYDLVLDVLVLPNQRPIVLDMDELSSTDEVTSAQAKHVSESLLKSAERIVNENLSTLPVWLR